MTNNRKIGGAGWVGLALYVAVFDYYAIKSGKETLSESFGRAMSHNISRPFTVLIVAGLLKHLMFPRFLPQVDPLAYVANKWRMGVESLTPNE